MVCASLSRGGAEALATKTRKYLQAEKMIWGNSIEYNKIYYSIISLQGCRVGAETTQQFCRLFSANSPVTVLFKYNITQVLMIDRTKGQRMQ